MTHSTRFRGAILLYHRVAPDTLDPYALCIDQSVFRRHLEFVQGTCTPMALTDLVDTLRDGGQAERAVAITFDDGYADNLTTASPMLDELGLPATFFVTTADLECPQVYWWDQLARSSTSSKHLVHDELVHATLEHRRDILAELRFESDDAILKAPRPMSGSELVQLASRPGHDVGVHTRHHLFLPSQSADVSESELGDCKADLERLLRRPVRTVAYPFGGETPQIAAIAERLGFEIGVTVQRDLVQSHADPLRLPRIDVSPRVNLESLLNEMFE